MQNAHCSKRDSHSPHEWGLEEDKPPQWACTGQSLGQTGETMVEIGGQTMTESQFRAAQFPLTDEGRQLAQEPVALTGVVQPPVHDDPVNHPKHYTSHPSGVECIEVVRHMGFNIGNVIKYLWRAGLKGEDKEIQDLEKAAWYLNDEIQRRKGVESSKSG